MDNCSQAESKELACPSVTTFMQYVLMRLNVTLINLDEPKVRLRPRHPVTACRGWTTRTHAWMSCAAVHHSQGASVEIAQLCRDSDVTRLQPSDGSVPGIAVRT